MRFLVIGPMLENYYIKSFPCLVDAVLYAKSFEGTRGALNIETIPF